MRPTKAVSLPEFVAMMAIIFATLAFSIDAMLPAFPAIAAELTPDAANRAQLIILAFMFGMGFGTIFSGPLSDAYGRKPIITFGIVIYIIGALLAYYSQSLEMILVARVIQGVGASGPRIVPMAMMRDLYEGRRMAQIGSFVMSVFMLVPAVAPSIGALIIDAAGWRYIFVAFIVFALFGGTWVNLRQPETLAVEDRRPLRVAKILEAAKEVVSNKLVMIYTAVLTVGFAQMISLISSTQQIYSDQYGQAENFPKWFALSALIAATGTILNAKLVMTVGMRKLALIAYAVQTIFALSFLVAFTMDIIPASLAFPVWFFWSVSIFFMAGLTFGNLNALALQPLGHIAGMAASIIAAISTIVAVFMAIPIGQAFNGTPVPLLIGTVVCSAIAFLLMRSTAEQEDV